MVLSHHSSGLSLFLAVFLFGCRSEHAELGIHVGHRGPPADVSMESPSPAADVEMHETQRRFLWQVEHHGNRLMESGVRVFNRFLAESDRSGLQSLLSAEFVGYLPGGDPQTTVRRGQLEIDRWHIEGKDVEAVSSEEFVTWLLQFRQYFTKTPHIKTSLMALHPLDRHDLDSIWQGSCEVRLWSDSGSEPPREIVLRLGFQVDRPAAESFANGHWLRQCRIELAQQAQAGEYLFEQVAEERGIRRAFLRDSWSTGEQMMDCGVYLCDYNRDGCSDLLITQSENSRLYSGKADGSFENVTVTTRLYQQHGARPVSPAAFVDLDGDGWQDLIWGPSIYRNNEGRDFTDITRQSNLQIPSYAMSICQADYDRDGMVDLYVTMRGNAQTSSWLEGDSGHQHGNTLWRNLGNWRFADVTGWMDADAGRKSTFSAVWFDSNNDGWSDLYVIHEFGNGVLLVNEQGKGFREEPLFEGPGEYGSMGVTCGDYNDDGHIDLYVAAMYSKAGNRVIGNVAADTYPAEVMAGLGSLTGGSKLHHNCGNGRFRETGESMHVSRIGWAYGPLMADLDNDGWLDIYATAGFKSIDRTKPDG